MPAHSHNSSPASASTPASAVASDSAPQRPSYLSKHVLVTGAGVTGQATAELLRALGVQFSLVDDNPTASADLPTAAAEQKLGECSCVVTSPGWRPTTPLLVKAAQQGIPVIGDVELAYTCDQLGLCGEPRTWLCITGTNGKSTTTAMLESIMREVDPTAKAVGNIGVAVQTALLAEPRINTLAVELSSFQLHWAHSIRPACGCLLNIADDHLDWHGSFDGYAADKKRVLSADARVLGVEDAVVREIAHSVARDSVTNSAAGVDAAANTVPTVEFTSQPPQPGQVGVEDGWIVDRWSSDDAVRIHPATEISPPGVSGQLDAAAAAAIALTQGVSHEAISKGLRRFRVARHRGEVVAELDGVTVIDNSKATNPHAADTALAGLTNVVWVAGGQLKGAAIDDLITRHADRIKAVVLLGVDADLIADACRRIIPDVPVYVASTRDKHEAMNEVATWAVGHAVPGDSIVLAPAAASLDMFNGMAERGDLFAAAVEEAWQIRLAGALLAGDGPAYGGSVVDTQENLDPPRATERESEGTP